MPNAAPKYQWRRLTSAQKKLWLDFRRTAGLPWHSPPHFPDCHQSHFHITAACYEHKPHIGFSPERLSSFSHELVKFFKSHGNLSAWCVLPNHYHALVQIADLRATLHDLGRFHGRTSYNWNLEEHCRGRKTFFRAADRAIRSDRHYWATINYIHHNAVHHGYVLKWADWPWSSAIDFLENTPAEEARRIWQEYPLRSYGSGWDSPEL